MILLRSCICRNSFPTDNYDNNVILGSKEINSQTKDRKTKGKYKDRHVVDVREGHNVTLECEGDGIPKPMIHWVILFPRVFPHDTFITIGMALDYFVLLFNALLSFFIL